MGEEDRAQSLTCSSDSEMEGGGSRSQCVLYKLGNFDPQPTLTSAHGYKELNSANGPQRNWFFSERSAVDTKIVAF